MSNPELKKFRSGFSQIKNISGIRRLPRLGKIKLGIKVATKKGANCKCKKAGDPGCVYCTRPKEVDYFVCPPEVEAVFGEKPKELDIMMPVSDLQVMFPQAYKWYGRGIGVKCIGDGEKAMRSGDDGLKEIECPCKHLRSDINPKGECGVVAHLLFLIPKVSFGGVFQIDTGSINSIIDVQSGLEYTAEMVASVTGQFRFNMIPLKLSRVRKETHGSGRLEIHYTLQIQPNVDQRALAALMENPRIIPQYTVETPKLTESTDTQYEDAEVIEATVIEKKEPKSSNKKDEKIKSDSAESDQKKPETKKTEVPKEDDPMTFSRVELINWLKFQCGAKYDKTIYNRMKSEMFGNTLAKDITIKGFQDFYEKLEKEALVKVDEKK